MQQPPVVNSLDTALRTSTAKNLHIVGVISVAAAFTVGIFLTYSFMNQKAIASFDARTTLAATAASETVQDSGLSEFAMISLVAQGAIIFDVSEQKTLFDHNADTQLPLASLTKVPLTLVITEVLAPEKTVTITRTTTPTVDATVLHEGNKYSVRDLVDFMLVASSNETAAMLGRAADAPLREKYPDLPKNEAAVTKMRELAKTLGLSQTFFMNVTGLDESYRQAGSYGSARDMATLFSYAASRADLFSATEQEQVTITSTNGTTAVAHNTNDALPRIPDMILGKTGYTTLAGGNLAVVFRVHDHVIAAVILGSTKTGRFSDMTTLVRATQKYFAGK